jgi:hypothetical protein
MDRSSKHHNNEVLITYLTTFNYLQYNYNFSSDFLQYVTFYSMWLFTVCDFLPLWLSTVDPNKIFFTIKEE